MFEFDSFDIKSDVTMKSRERDKLRHMVGARRLDGPSRHLKALQEGRQNSSPQRHRRASRPVLTYIRTVYAQIN